MEDRRDVGTPEAHERERGTCLEMVWFYSGHMGWSGRSVFARHMEVS